MGLSVSIIRSRILVTIARDSDKKFTFSLTVGPLMGWSSHGDTLSLRFRLRSLSYAATGALRAAVGVGLVRIIALKMASSKFHAIALIINRAEKKQ